MFEKLIKLANELDKRGFYSEANEIDMLIKQSGFFDMLFKSSPPTCGCSCVKCGEAKTKLADTGIGPGMSGYMSIISSHCKNHAAGCQFGS